MSKDSLEGTPEEWADSIQDLINRGIIEVFYDEKGEPLSFALVKKEKIIKYKGKNTRGRDAYAYLKIQERPEEMFYAQWSPGGFQWHPECRNHYQALFDDIVGVSEQLDIWFCDLRENGLLNKSSEMGLNMWDTAELPLKLMDSFVEFYGNLVQQVVDLMPTPE